MNIVLGNWKFLPTKDLRLRPQFTQNKGFFCSLVWILQCLPYIEDHYKQVGFQFYSHNYGSYPDFSVFGKFLLTKFPSIPNTPSIDLKTVMTFGYKPLSSKFVEAHRLFFTFFDFSPDIYTEASKISNLFTNKKILGLHYRGTDKNLVQWADHTSIDDFILIINDYLRIHHMDGIFFCTDSLSFKNKMISTFSNRYPLYYNKNQSLSEQPLHLSRLTVIEPILKSIRNGHSLEDRLLLECSINESELKSVILDCIVLSRCSSVIKTHSLLSSFSKIINPDLDIYRLNGCSEIYYPESFIPFYTSSNINIDRVLRRSRRLPY